MIDNSKKRSVRIPKKFKRIAYTYRMVPYDDDKEEPDILWAIYPDGKCEYNSWDDENQQLVKKEKMIDLVRVTQFLHDIFDCAGHSTDSIEYIDNQIIELVIETEHRTLAFDRGIISGNTSIEDICSKFISSIE